MRTSNDERRAVLAFVASYGIAHYNSTIDRKSVYIKYVEEGFPDANKSEIERVLKLLSDDGLVRKWNTGHNGYGGAWVEGSDTYEVTQKGLMALWNVAV